MSSGGQACSRLHGRFPGLNRLHGRVVHPQQWSEDVDYTNKKVVIIGSGATAVTLLPDDDFLEAVKNNTVSVVTDHIDSFTENGIKLKSGRSLEADLVVTATGLEQEVFNGIALSVDGKPVIASARFIYKGMYSNVPDLAISVGYNGLMDFARRSHL